MHRNLNFEREATHLTTGFELGVIAKPRAEVSGLRGDRPAPARVLDHGLAEALVWGGKNMLDIYCFLYYSSIKGVDVYNSDE